MLDRIKKFLRICFQTFQRKVEIPCKIKFLSVHTAIREENIYEENVRGFKSCLLFCHYNKYGIVLPQVRQICLFFQSLGIDVVFLTTKVSDDSRDWLKSSVSALLIRKNIGRDFGAWKDGISFLKRKSFFEECSELYLINDSLLIIGDYLEDVEFQDKFINDRKTDVIGLTESWQKAYHLQSYFLKFNRNVLCSKIFSSYWSNFPLINSRLFSIENGEIGISQMLLKNGYSLKPLYPISELLKKDVIEKFLSILNISSTLTMRGAKQGIFNEFFNVDFNDMNPSHRLWPLLLINKCPILKKDLIEKNPEGLISMKHFILIYNLICNNTKNYNLLLESLKHLNYLKHLIVK